MIVYGFPILLGIVCGLLFTFWILIGLTVVTAVLAFFTWLQTRNQELASLIGVIAIALTVIFNASMWFTYGLAEDQFTAINFDWLIRK